MTVNIALNRPDDYTGAGTLIEALEPAAVLDAEPVEGLRGSDGAVRLPKGHALVHPGNARHAGAAIRSGVRWVLVCFIDGHETTASA